IGKDDSEPFCKSRALNQAARQANGNVFIIADADVMYDPGLIDRVLELILDHPWIIPFYPGIRLTRKATERILQEGITSFSEINAGDIEEYENHAGCFINAMTRECFETIQGMDERFQGWGGEDGALVYSLDTMFGPHYRMNETIYHLWHPRPVLDDTYYQPNMNLLIRYRDANGNRTAMSEILRGKTVQWEKYVDFLTNEQTDRSIF
ncbi:MAG: galactosyltransferase-related protein, partial [Bacteroidota bacterium]|nr:galactosyltransferase-related protein [Bacteroidota bacterium]